MKYRENDYADACLIAAAPDLVDVLERLARVARRLEANHDGRQPITRVHWMDLRAILEDARAVLAKVPA